jgi:hypothetical protein
MVPCGSVSGSKGTPLGPMSYSASDRLVPRPPFGYALPVNMSRPSARTRHAKVVVDELALATTHGWVLGENSG